MSDAAQSAEGIVLARLEDQQKWYDRKSGLNQKRYKLLKFFTISSAALIPVVSVAGAPYSKGISAGLGVAIAIIEGVLQLNQYQSHWITYRATAETLLHEKILYLAKAGAYRGLVDPVAALAERIEALMSQEQTKWITVQSPKEKPNETVE